MQNLDQESKNLNTIGGDNQDESGYFYRPPSTGRRSGIKKVEKAGNEELAKILHFDSI